MNHSIEAFTSIELQTSLLKYESVEKWDIEKEMGQYKLSNTDFEAKSKKYTNKYYRKKTNIIEIMIYHRLIEFNRVGKKKYFPIFHHWTNTNRINFDDFHKEEILIEKIKGRTLQDYLNLFNNIDIKLIMKWIFQLIDIITELNKLHIVHRDLKPDNIVVTEQDNDLVVIDFNVSKIDNLSPIYGKTEQFGPKEQNHPTEETDTVDIYSLGKTIYYIFTHSTGPTQEINKDYLFYLPNHPAIERLIQMFTLPVADRPSIASVHVTLKDYLFYFKGFAYFGDFGRELIMKALRSTTVDSTLPFIEIFDCSTSPFLLIHILQSLSVPEHTSDFASLSKLLFSTNFIYKLSLLFIHCTDDGLKSEIIVFLTKLLSHSTSEHINQISINFLYQSSFLKEYVNYFIENISFSPIHDLFKQFIKNNSIRYSLIHHHRTDLRLFNLLLTFNSDPSIFHSPTKPNPYFFPSTTHVLNSICHFYFHLDEFQSPELLMKILSYFSLSGEEYQGYFNYLFIHSKYPHSYLNERTFSFWVDQEKAISSQQNQFQLSHLTGVVNEIKNRYLNRICTSPFDAMQYFLILPNTQEEVCLPCYWKTVRGNKFPLLTSTILRKYGRCKNAFLNLPIFDPSPTTDYNLLLFQNTYTKTSQYWKLNAVTGKIKEGNSTALRLERQTTPKMLVLMDAYSLEFNPLASYYLEVEIGNCDAKEIVLATAPAGADPNPMIGIQGQFLPSRNEAVIPPEIQLSIVKLSGSKSGIGYWLDNSTLYHHRIYYSSSGKICISDAEYPAPTFFLNDTVGFGYSSRNHTLFFTLNGYIVFILENSQNHLLLQNTFTVHNAAIISNVSSSCRFKYSRSYV